MNNKKITPVLLSLALASMTAACADPCVDDGLGQRGNEACAGFGSAGLGGETDTESESDSVSGVSDTAITDSGVDSDEGSGGASDTDGDSDSDSDSDSSGASCNNGVQDGAETDIDCGGVCDSCESGEGCSDDSDCSSDECLGGDVCVSDTDWCADISAQTLGTGAVIDIIVVIDNSSSMESEVAQVQARLNGFSDKLASGGVDAHFILISSYPGDENGLCVAPPLGGGSCPTEDNNPPYFVHVDDHVDSSDLWDSLLDTFPSWSWATRAEAKKHVVVITDDEDDMDFADFDAAFRGLGTPFSDYMHHSVVPHTLCPSAEAIGTPYIENTWATGGVAADLCQQDFDEVFDALASGVVPGAEQACELGIPAVPAGQSFDPGEVEFRFDNGQGDISLVPQVANAEACSADTMGWYFDLPAAPTRIIACPSACEVVNETANGSVEVFFGCN